ncbi:hypothetical protein L1987_62356 [Smallanthus sonchifolius]|uniref:Uncharacterized protein n=1 Tax=Smallanthus sonchifolius TaxID=185202 RepID=A0ACB9CAH3_9ASTR|nr:hypothetical protein L1987_62356 [Smallanthus sonchifolius]
MKIQSNHNEQYLLISKRSNTFITALNVSCRNRFRFLVYAVHPILMFVESSYLKLQLFSFSLYRKAVTGLDQ